MLLSRASLKILTAWKEKTFPESGLLIGAVISGTVSTSLVGNLHNLPQKHSTTNFCASQDMRHVTGKRPF